MVILCRTALAAVGFDTGGGCGTEGDPIFSLPAPDSVGVPLDVSPAFIYTAGDCDALERTLQLIHKGTSDETASATADVTDGLGELVPTEALAADTAWVLTSEGASDSAEITFTTGSTMTVAAGIVPTVTSLAATWTDGPPRLTVDATVTYSGGGGRDLIAQWSDGPPDALTESAITRVGAPGLSDSASWDSARDPTSAPERWCVQAQTRELDGAWLLGDVSCVDVESTNTCGCATAAPGAATAAALGAGFVIVGRRRR
ncbi:MAG: hypothetical protein EXR71_11025 [Myxococcales bacterium]|nr:hypothetical protein [Myxococcales bacterium]